MLNIILTIDYEIFGDGTGDVKKHIIKPTDKILKICDEYSVPLTIMFEVNEYQKFVEYESELVRDLGYSPAQEMQNQVLNAYSRGHDIQLHIHPQWIDAEYSSGRWTIKNPNRSISEFSKEKTGNIISEGKGIIEKLIHEVDKSYSVRAMRLTNLPWIEAPVEVHDAMKQNHICFHSLSISDSPKNNKKGLWQLDSDRTIFEIPIHSVTMPGYRRFTWNRIKTALYRRIYTYDSVSFNSDIKKQNKKGISIKVKEILIKQQALKWDFCKQSCKEMLKLLDVAMQRYDYCAYDVPLVMIGHSKDFFNTRNFHTFLKIVKKRYCNSGAAVFTTLFEYSRLHKIESEYFQK